jgi:hypothetical protein
LVRLAEISPPEEGIAAAEEELHRLVKAVNPDVVIPLDDASLQLCGTTLGGSDALAGPSGEQLKVALDKRVQVEAARKAGFDVPDTRSISSAEEALDGVEPPVVLKPALANVERNGRLARGKAFVCGNRTELERAIRATPPNEPMLVQPLLFGTGEGLFGLATPRGTEAWTAHRRIRMTNPQGSGSSACTSVAVDQQVIEPTARMLGAVGWRGLFMVETLRDHNGVAWFMELNGRAWGSMALARRQGFEYPAWAAELKLDPDFRPPDVRFQTGQVTCRHLGAEIVHLLFVLRGPRSAALAGWPGRLRTISDLCRFRRSDRWYNLRSGELPVFLDDTFGTVLHEIGLR